MFARGNWAVFGIARESHAEFVLSLENQKKMLLVSQATASARTRYLDAGSSGINPFSMPRLDEEQELSQEEGSSLANYSALSEDDRETYTIAPAILDSQAYAFGERRFLLTGSAPLYGLWFVQNEWKDISDLASLKEQAAYDNHDRPYKFLTSGPKKELDQEIRAKTAASRKQVPVLIDFVTGRIYIENTNKNFLFFVRHLLENLGLVFMDVAWSFGDDSNWPSQALAVLRAESRFLAEFDKASKDATRFSKPEEREIIEDPEVAKLVRDYFLTTELESELWASVSTPAQIKLHPGSAPITVPTPVQATELLGITDDAFVAGASITLQERSTSVNKKTETEKVFRKDIVSFDLNDQINLTEAGAALLRGFDLPSFRRDLMKEIKKSKQVPSIEGFWLQWLQDMNEGVRNIEHSLRDVLQLDANAKVGIQPLFDGDNNAVIEGFTRLAEFVTDGSLTVSMSSAPGSEG